MHFKTEIALTNARALLNTLQSNDKNLYVAVHNRIHTIGKEIFRKCSVSIGSPRKF